MAIALPFLHLQWHVTARCQHRCQHCYMYDSDTYEKEIKNELTYEQCIRIIDDFADTLARLPARGGIDFTGGDPLLRKDIFDLLAHTRRKGIRAGIMGNPDLIDREMAEKLRHFEIFRYQMSLDGMEDLHDSLRSRGSFKNVLRAAKLLKEAEIKVNIMNTLSRHNAHDLLPLMRRVARERIASFSFARLSAVGSGSQYRDDLLEPLAYREIYLNYFKEAALLKRKGMKTEFIKKDHLWIPLFLEEGWLRELPASNDGINYGGCALGGFGLIILADGTASACRRFTSPLGRMPEQTFTELFFHSKELARMRDSSNYEKCSRCELNRFCRGCPAAAYGAHGNCFAPDPQCWREVGGEERN